MENEQPFQERAVKVERPKHHFVFLTASDGAMLGLDDLGKLALFDEADDRVIWDRTETGFEHVASAREGRRRGRQRDLRGARRHPNEVVHRRPWTRELAVRIPRTPAAGRLGVSDLHSSARQG